MGQKVSLTASPTEPQGGSGVPEAQPGVGWPWLIYEVQVQVSLKRKAASSAHAQSPTVPVAITVDRPVPRPSTCRGDKGPKNMYQDLDYSIMTFSKKKPSEVSSSGVDE